MASEIRGFTDPSSLQAFEGLVGQEQFNRQMGMAGMQNMQNQQLAQQSMALQQQELQNRMAMDQARMAQAQGQFQSSLEEAQREREYRTAEREAGQKFDQEQMAAIQKWEQGKINDLRRYELEMEELELRAEDARAKGDMATRQALIAAKKDIGIKRSRISAELAQKNLLAGSTMQRATQVMGDMATKIKQQISAQQQSARLGSGLADPLLNQFREQGKNRALTGLQRVAENQFFGISRSANENVIAASLGEIPGSEFLILDTDFFAGAKGLLPGQIADASFVKGELDPADVTRIIQEDLANSFTEVFRPYGLTSESALREAISAGTVGGNKIEVGKKLIQAGLDPTAMRSLVRNLIEKIEGQDAQSLQSLMAQESQRTGGQDSLRTRAYMAKQRANAATSSMLRRLESVIDVADEDELQAGLAAFESFRETGQLTPLMESQIRSSGVDPSGLSGLYGTQRALASDIANLGIQLGDLAEQDELAQLDALIQSSVGEDAARQQRLLDIPARRARLGP